MSRGRIVKALATGLMMAALILPANAASATPLRPKQPLAQSISVSPPKGSPGTFVTVTGSSFLCANAVNIYWQYTFGDPIVTQYVGSAFVARGGSFRLGVHVPDARPGPSTVIARASNDPSCGASTPFKICECDLEGYMRDGWN